MRVDSAIARIEARISQIESRMEQAFGVPSESPGAPRAGKESTLAPYQPLEGELRSLARDAAERHGVNPDTFERMISAESSGNARAVSRAGAMGLAQLMPATAQALGVDDPFDPEQSLDGGARYLKSLMDRFGDERLAVAAYNAGPGAVRRYGDVPPFSETQNYVRKVLGP